MKNRIKKTGIILIVIVAVVTAREAWQLRDRHPGYEINLNIKAPDHPARLKAGFAAEKITPVVVDTWEDVNHDAKYKPKDGDKYHDNNGNGKFDAWWIAGFGNKRAANGVHDDVWSRTMVLDDGQTRIALVALDAIGFRSDDVIDVRERIPKEAGIDYTIICSTHDHESFDLLGIWGKSILKSGVNKEHLEVVKNRIVTSITEAVQRLRPVHLRIAGNLTDAAELMMDTRDPIVMEPGLRMIQAVDAETGSTLGVLVAWANHAETLWSDNLYITSDYPHYVREYIEKGVYNGDSLVKPGLGGTAVYVNGEIGGLMTTRGSMPVKDPFRDTAYVKPSFDKARAEGQKLALLALIALEQPDTVITEAGISLAAETVTLPLDNKMFRLGVALGVLDFGMTGWMKTRSEIAAFTLGPVSFLAVPGEIYPEIINGGIEAPEGQDFDIDPVEVPPLRELMPGKYKFILGLANDEIGYIIPKSQWDVKAPYTYGRDNAPYGEENSLGPETAPLLHRSFRKLLEKWQP